MGGEKPRPLALPRSGANWRLFPTIAQGMDVTFVISTDSHHPRELARMEWGALHATRGWVDPRRVANTWPREKFLAWLHERRS